MPARRVRKGQGLARRPIANIERKAGARAERIAQFVLEAIKFFAPYDSRIDTDTRGPHLRDSYSIKAHPSKKGTFAIVSSRRYWVFVEFGTAEHGDAQPHIRPALELAHNKYGGGR